MTESEAQRRVKAVIQQRAQAEQQYQDDWEAADKPTTVNSAGVVRQLGAQPLDANQLLSNTTAGAGVPIAGSAVPGGIVGDWVPRFFQEDITPPTVSQKWMPCFMLAIESSPLRRRRRITDYTRRFWLWDGKDSLKEIDVDTRFAEVLTVVEYRRSSYNPATGVSVREVNVLDTIAPGETKTYTTTDARGGYEREYDFIYSTEGWLDWTITDPDPTVPNENIGDEANAFACDAYIVLQYQCDKESDLLISPSESASLTGAFLGDADVPVGVDNAEPVLSPDGWFLDVWSYPGNYLRYSVAESAIAGATEIKLQPFFVRGGYTSPTTKLPIGYSFYLRYDNGTPGGVFSEKFTILSRTDDLYTITPPLAQSVDLEYYTGRRTIAEPNPYAEQGSSRFHGSTQFLGSGFVSGLDPATSIRGANGKTVAIGTYNPSNFMDASNVDTDRSWRVFLRWYPPLSKKVALQQRSDAGCMAQCSRDSSGRLYGTLITPSHMTILTPSGLAQYGPDDTPVPAPCPNSRYWKIQPFANPDTPTAREISAVRDGYLGYRGKGIRTKSPAFLSDPALQDLSAPSQPSALQQLLNEEMTITFQVVPGSRKIREVRIKRIPWEQITDDKSKVQLIFTGCAVHG